jgi:hypothetical protein
LNGRDAVSAPALHTQNLPLLWLVGLAQQSFHNRAQHFALAHVMLIAVVIKQPKHPLVGSESDQSAKPWVQSISPVNK